MKLSAIRNITLCGCGVTAGDPLRASKVQSFVRGALVECIIDGLKSRPGYDDDGVFGWLCELGKWQDTMTSLGSIHEILTRIHIGLNIYDATDRA